MVSIGQQGKYDYKGITNNLSLEIKSSNVTIENLNLKVENGTAINIVNSSDVTLINCNIIGSHNGIEILNSSNIKLLRCTIISSNSCVNLEDVKYFKFENCKFHSDKDGIILTRENIGYIDKCIFKNCHRGIYIKDYWSKLMIRENIFENVQNSLANSTSHSKIISNMNKFPNSKGCHLMNSIAQFDPNELIIEKNKSRETTNNLPSSDLLKPFYNVFVIVGISVVVAFIIISLLVFLLLVFVVKKFDNKKK